MSELWKPWTKRPQFVAALDPQATERLVNKFVHELCDEIENLTSTVKSLPPGEHLAHCRGEYDALHAILRRMQDYGIIATELEATR